MLSNFSSNALLAKARAMYGRRLTKQNFTDLLNCQSVSEVTHYLKNDTDYSATLAGINETEIHRGQLEARLKQRIFEDSASLCRYELSVGEHFSWYLIARNEIDQILHSLMLLNAGTPEEYIFSMPRFLVKHTKINLTALSRIKTYEDLLDAVGHTPYRKILEPFRPISGLTCNYTGIENALYAYLYKNIFLLIDQYTHGETTRQLKQIFQSYIDLYNFVRIIRLKQFYHAGVDFIRSSLLPYGTISEKHLSDLISAETQEEMVAAMKRTTVGKKCLKLELDKQYIDNITTRVQYLTCRRDIRFSTHPSVVMLSYIFLRQIELSDIITIVEGIRYQLPSTEIAKMLTILNFE